METNSTIIDTPCQLYLGTSGYSFPEWIQAGFYPPGTANKDMLSFYARQFNAIEINNTWYHMPRVEAMERMLSRVPDGFMFTAKLTRTMTHEVDLKNWRSQLKSYRIGVAPLVQARQLLAVLVQLGPAFQRTRENRLYLARLLDELEGLRAAVEFRYRSWADDKVFAELEKRRVALLTVDVPDLPHLFPSRAIVTNPELFYVRFHGRNALGWRSGNMQKKFDYDYSFQELKPWSQKLIPKMAESARTGVIFFNNHVRGQAPRNAQLLAEQLSGQGFSMTHWL
jgi:uncharacterized protein YecE (DUF72 family)